MSNKMLENLQAFLETDEGKKSNPFPIEEAKKQKRASPEQLQIEIEKCQGFEYFYNNYCKIDAMPKYSEEASQDYLKMAEEARYIIGRTRRGKALSMRPLTPNESYEGAK